MSSRKPSGIKATDGQFKDGAETADYFKDDTPVKLGEVLKEDELDGVTWEKLSARVEHLKETFPDKKVTMGRVLKLTIDTALDNNGSFTEWAKKRESSRSSSAIKPGDNKTIKNKNGNGLGDISDKEIESNLSSIGSGSGAAVQTAQTAKS